MMKKMIFLSIISISFAATRGMEDEGKPSEHFMRRTRKFFGDITQCAGFLASARMDDSMTPLGKAAYKNNLMCARILIKLGDRKVVNNFVNPYRMTPLRIATKEGYFGMAKLLLENGADVNEENVRGWWEGSSTDAFVGLDVKKCIRFVKLFSKYNVDMDRAEWLGITTLHRMTYKGGLSSCMKSMIEYGANPNVKTDTGGSPLHAVTFSGDLDTLDALVHHGGADVDATDNYGHTVLRDAVFRKKTELVKALVGKYNAKVDEKDIDLVRYYKKPRLRVYPSIGLTPQFYKDKRDALYYNEKRNEILSILQEAMRNQEESQKK